MGKNEINEIRMVVRERERESKGVKNSCSLFDAKKEGLKEYIDYRTGYRKKQETANFTEKSNSVRGEIAGKNFFKNVNAERINETKNGSMIENMTRETSKVERAFMKGDPFFLYVSGKERNNEKLKRNEGEQKFKLENEDYIVSVGKKLKTLIVNSKCELAAERGITLLALIITVVIMIILAAVTINVTLGDGGIVQQAKTAAEKAQQAAQSEQEQLASLGQELANLLAEPAGPAQVDGVTIPDGFYYVGGTKAEGIVISDSPEDENKGTSHEVAQTLKGNQFVWIPVEDDSAFKRYEGYYDGELDSYLSSCSEPFANGYTNEQSDYDAMKDNVFANDGFYVGRYEAGTTNSARNEGSGITDEVLVQQGKYVYNYVGWSNSNDMTVETGGAVELSKNFANQKGYSSVTSSLIYGVQWDAIMNFIDPAYATGSCAEDSFVRDSSGKGWYGQSGPTTTGSNANYAVKNIYDLGGNVAEWTMEALGPYHRVVRGGFYSYSGLEFPASYRIVSSPSDTYGSCGFRLVLYVK